MHILETDFRFEFLVRKYAYADNFKYYGKEKGQSDNRIIKRKILERYSSTIEIYRKKMRERPVRRDVATEMAGTAEHECKEMTRKRSQKLRAIENKTNLTSQKISNLLQKKFKMGLISYVLCVIDILIENRFLNFMNISIM